MSKGGLTGLTGLTELPLAPEISCGHYTDAGAMFAFR